MPSQRIHTLRYAIRPRVLLRHLGLLLLVLSGLGLPPLLVAAVDGDWTMSARLAGVLAALAASGALLARLQAPRHIQLNEALTVIALTFVIGAGAMVWPMMSAGLALSDAWFEAISGITTTGLTTLASVEDKPLSFLFLRAWMQWYGGLGIVVLSVGLLMRHSAASRRLAVADVTGDTLLSTTRVHAQRVLLAYLALTVVGLVAIGVATGQFQATVLHTLTAVSTGGFSSFDDNIAGFGSTQAAATVMGVAWLGAVSLPLYYSIWTRGWKPFVRDAELHALIIATLLAMALVAVLGGYFGDMGWRDALILGASAQSGTGFTTLSAGAGAPPIELVLMVAMLIGGCIGSTTGGIKWLRVLVLWRVFQLSILRTGAPQHAVMEPRLGGRRLGYDDVARALLLVALFAGLVGLSWLVFLLHGYDPMDALFEVVSASATVGLSTGISRPDLEPLLKAVLCFDMIAGRVEIVAVLVALYPGTWFGKRVKSL